MDDIRLTEKMTPERWEAMTPAQRKRWFCGRMASADSDQDRLPTPQLTRDDLRRLSMLPAPDPDERDHDHRRLRERLRAARA